MVFWTTGTIAFLDVSGKNDGVIPVGGGIINTAISFGGVTATDFVCYGINVGADGGEGGDVLGVSKN